jgi:hypothetical protein
MVLLCLNSPGRWDDGGMVLLWLNSPGRWDDGGMVLLLLKFHVKTCCLVELMFYLSNEMHVFMMYDTIC